MMRWMSVFSVRVRHRVGVSVNAWASKILLMLAQAAVVR
jgi:hypothetical protein